MVLGMGSGHGNMAGPKGVNMKRKKKVWLTVAALLALPVTQGLDAVGAMPRVLGVAAEALVGALLGEQPDQQSSGSNSSLNPPAP